MDEYISIIITAYNAQRWLDRCLESVIAAADKNCEIIIVDDGSVDATAQIAQKYESEDDRVTCYIMEHQGMSAARRYGVKHCNGDSVMFVDCDDMLPKQAIMELRAASVDGCDIVCGNIVLHDIHNKKRLTLSGSFEVVSGTEFATRALDRGMHTTMHGKKFARYLFDVNDWDTDTSLASLYQRVHLLHLACSAEKVAIAPRAVVYNHISRKNSMSSMFTLHHEGVERAWQSVRNLPLPTKNLTEWGLDLIDNTLLQRGYPFSNDFQPVVELRELSKGLSLSPHHKKIARLLSSKQRRLTQARDNSAQGNMSTITPHYSFIVPIYNNAHKFLRTLKSILHTGLRNIEIIAVDDASDRRTSVALSAITIRYPRVILHRHPTRFGMAQAYRTGLNVATAKAIYFIDAGDIIKRDGIFESGRLIDDGADIVFIGIKSQLWRTPIKWDYFRPSDWAPMKLGTDEMLFSIIGTGAMSISMRSMAFNRNFISSDMLCERGVTYGSGYLSFINVLLTHPTFAHTDTCGFINASGDRLRTHVIKRHCKLNIDLARRTRDTLTAAGRSTEYTDSLIAQGLICSFARSLAAIIANPLRGCRVATKLAHSIFTWESTEKLFEELNYQIPDIDEIIERATKIANNLRYLYLLGCQPNY
jgi:glycosyltransferase involved in cell wall biosynthesis